MKTIGIYIFLISSLLSFNIKAEDKIIIGGLDGLNANNNQESYSILLALSGGGARGLSVIGILKAFKEKNIHVVAITGTSIGGIIGGLYASGYTPGQLDSITSGLDFNSLFSNSPSRKSMFLTQRQGRDQHLISIRFDKFRPIIPQALTAGQKLTAFLTDLTTKANYHSHSDFSHLTIPFKTISTDIVSGKKVILDKGSLVEAMRATMAFPLAFTGLEKDGQILMDGGMVTPIPVDLVRQMSDSVNFVVAINTASKLVPKKDIVTPLDIANQVTSIMTADKLARQLAHADFVVEPPLNNFKSTDFKDKDSIIALGYRSGLTASDSIISLIRKRTLSKNYHIIIINTDSVPKDIILPLEDHFLNKTLTQKELITRLKKISLKLNLFRIEADIIPLDKNSNGTTRIALKFHAYHNFTFSKTHFKFSGNAIFDDTTLALQLLTSDSLITPRVLKKGLRKILKLYKEKGYDLAYIKKIDIYPPTKTISFDIDEAIIKRIDIENNYHTRDWLVRSYFPLKVGQPYSTSHASRGVANIYGTDLFNQVTVNLTPYHKGAIVKIKVDEKKYNQMRLGWHWNDEYHSEEFIEFINDNVGGMGLEYLAHARYSPDRQKYFTTFKANRIFSTYLTSKISIFHYFLKRQLYTTDNNENGYRKEKKTGMDIILGQQIARLGTLSAGFTFEKVNCDNTNTNAKQSFGLRIFKIESLVENFNRIRFPTTGEKHLVQLQLAGKYFGGDVEYTKFFSSLETYLPINKYINYHPKIAVGISRSGLPPSEKFYLGGIHSFAGFRTDQLAGDKMFILTNEIRFKLPLRLYFSARHDMGEVYKGADQIKLRNLRHAVGVYLSLDSPLGPIEFGYGIANKHTDHFYLNIGLAF